MMIHPLPAADALLDAQQGGHETPSGRRILIVEDDETLAVLIRYNLEAERYSVEHIARGDKVEARLQEGGIDLVILDWSLPGCSGLEICRRARAQDATRYLPIIMVSARGEESDRVLGLSAGADDYLAKPFSFRELVARVEAILRRAGREEQRKQLACGEIRLDAELFRAWRGARELSLTPLEFKLLKVLIEKPGRVYRRDQLVSAVWGPGAVIDDRTVDVHIGRLRRAILCGADVDPLRTVRGVGYAFDENSAALSGETGDDPPGRLRMCKGDRSLAQ